MDAAKNLLSEVPGGPVFHYTSQKGLLGIITGRKIWASNILYLNDSTEMSYAVDLALAQLPVPVECKDENDVAFWAEVEKRLKAITGFNIKSVYVCSFSSNLDQLSQWRGYCPDGSGYSIGFDFNSPMYDHVRKQGFSLYKCVYDPGAQIEIIVDFLKSALDTFHKTLYVIGTGWPAEFVASYEFEIDFLKIAPLLKHPKFVEEQEWRLISQPIALDNPRVNFREGKSMVVPFFEIELAETYENLTVSKICIGPTHHPNLSENAIYSLLTAKGVHNCFVEVSKVPYRAW